VAAPEAKLLSLTAEELRDTLVALDLRRATAEG
jgi:hypothetical protein